MADVDGGGEVEDVPSPDLPEEAEVVRRAIVDRVSHDVATWFPGTPAGAPVHLRPLSIRRRSRIYAVSVGEPTSAPLLVAKARTRNSANREPAGGGTGGQGRPVLATAAADEEELTAREYAGLRLLEATFAEGDDRFGAVRPLAHLEAHNTILMEFVPGPTVRDLLLRSSRLRLGRGRPDEASLEQLLPRVGVWLRRFHDAAPTAATPARQATGEEVVAHFAALEEHLARTLGRRFGDLAGTGSALAAQVLPAGPLPLAVGHGDFAPRNVVVAPGGRLVVLDPLTRWAVPEPEDLCRFLVGVRLLGLQLHTHGAAYGAATLERWERLVIGGYYGDRVPVATLRCFQLLILFDKWSAMLEPAAHGRWRTRVVTASQRLATGYVRREAQRLLELARSADG